MMFDPNKAFLKLPVVWVTTSIICLCSTLFIINIIYFSNLSFRFDYVGLNNAVEIFKLPLTILALIIPIFALLSSNHRSEQTKEQIRVSMEQNNFTNYFKHVEEFEKYCKTHLVNASIKRHKLTHKVIYPKARYGNYTVSDDCLHFLTKQSELTVEALKVFDTIGYNTPMIVKNIDTIIVQLEQYFYCSLKRNSGIVFDVEGTELIIDNKYTSSYIRFIKDCFSNLSAMVNFEGNLLTNNYTLHLDELNLSLVPEFEIFTPHSKQINFNLFHQ